MGLERTILPKIAEVDFGIAAKTAVMSFIVVFGISKAITNYYAGAAADQVGRRNLLIYGWLFGFPVPILLMIADSWGLIIAANILLGVNQGLTWSSTVVMKIDLVGEKDRGFAMGVNESVGYLAVGCTAFFSGWIAGEFGLRPYPFYLGVGFATFGTLASIWIVKDTRHHVVSESAVSNKPLLKNTFRETSWANHNLGSITQAGLVNNLNDGMMWGLLPVLLMSREFDLLSISKIVAIYPIVWGVGQLITGKMADIFNVKRLLFIGMLLQGLVITGMFLVQSYWLFILLCTMLGIGTAIVYPTFLAAISTYAHPAQRAKTIGVFRLWRDLGYAVGALITGIISDLFSVEIAILVVGFTTVGSAFFLQLRMDK